LGKSFFEEKGINFRAYNELKQKVKLHMDLAAKANLIIKRSDGPMHSIIREAKNVSFSLKETNDGLEMQLADDGQGFKMDKVSQVNGLGKYGGACQQNKV